MKKSILYLCVSIAFLIALVQCKDSVTQSTNTNQDINEKASSVSAEKQAPALIAPENEAAEVDRRPHFKWKAVGGAYSYELHVSRGNQMIIEQKVENANFIPSEELSAEATYYWRVRAVGDGTDGKWSEIDSFTTGKVSVDSLPAPAQVAPENEVTGVPLQPSIEWEAVEGADAYTLHVSHGNEMVVEKQVEGTSFTLPEKLSTETTYYWRVKAVRGEWSEVHSFTTTETEVASDPLPAPAQVAPENEVTGVPLQPSIEWEAVEGADAYTLHVSHGNEMVVEKQVEGTSFTLPEKLSTETTYYWRVKAVRGEWSEVHSFTTTETEVASDPLPAPAQVAPGEDAKGVAQKPEFKWKTVDGASKYSLHISQGNKKVIEQQVEQGTSFTPSKKLDAEATYDWRVQAVSDGTEGKWSDSDTFTTLSETANTPPVNLNSPVDGDQGQPTTILLEWAALDGITSYQLQLASSSSFNSPKVDQVIDGTSHEVSSLGNNQTYYWRVQADGDGNIENWSSIRSFTTEERNNIDQGGDAVSDRAALMDLYEATGGDQWKNNSGWGQGAPSNSWHGIQVNSQGLVTEVDLYNNGLRGQLPESLGELKEAIYLNLKNNKLTGPIPQSIGSMENLETLILSGRTYEIGGTLKEPPENLNYAYHAGKRSSSTNRFEGTIPASVGNLSNLQFLEISDQPDITGPIPSELGSLSNLKGLYLNKNDFDGYRIPETLGNLTELRHFYISGSNVIGQLPAGLKNMRKLTYITVKSTETGGKGLTGALPDFSNLTNLRSIVLTNNEFEGPYPSYFNNGNFTKLNTLRISWSNLTGSLHGFDNLPALESLGLEGNNLSGSIKQQLMQLPERLQILGLGWNNFSGELPQSGWADFYQLKTLYLNNNNLDGAIPCDFWNKIDNPRLGIAWVSNNNFSSNCTRAMNNVKGAGNPDIQAGENNF